MPTHQRRPTAGTLQGLFAPPGSPGTSHHLQGGASPSASMFMSPLPVLHNSGVVQPSGLDWGQAAGNLEDAKLAVQALKELVDDAVFLDEEAYTRAAEVSHLQHRIHMQQKRMRDMELEMAAVQAEVVAKDQALAAAAARHRELAAQVAELQQELDNNSVVFKMHFSELITRNEEIARLNQLVQDLQRGAASMAHASPGPSPAQHEHHGHAAHPGPRSPASHVTSPAQQPPFVSVGGAGGQSAGGRAPNPGGGAAPARRSGSAHLSPPPHLAVAPPASQPSGTLEEQQHLSSPGGGSAAATPSTATAAQQRQRSLGGAAVAPGGLREEQGSAGGWAAPPGGSEGGGGGGEAGEGTADGEGEGQAGGAMEAEELRAFSEEDLM